MRPTPWALVLLSASGCAQEVEHPRGAPACDAAKMDCRSAGTPEVGGVGRPGQAGESAVGDEVATFSGRVIAFGDDYFQGGAVFAGTAEVSAAGEGGARVAASYAGTSFRLEGVLKEPANWFLVEPAGSSGLLPTLTAIDTRIASTELLAVGAAAVDDVEGIFLNLGTDLGRGRAQLVLRVVDAQNRPMAGVSAALTAEVTAYRLGSAWIANATASDATGMIFFGNVQAASDITTTGVALSGAVNARLTVALRAGATTMVTAVVTPK